MSTDYKDFYLLASKGLSNRAIARELGVSRYRVACVLKKYKCKNLNIEEIHCLISEYYSKASTADELASKFNISLTTLYLIISQYGSKENIEDRYYRKYRVENENYFESIDSEGKAYFLGLIVADGYLVRESNRLGIELNINDGGHLGKLKKEIGSNAPIKSRKRKSKSTGKINESSYFRWSSKKMRSDLIKLGLTANKSYNLKSLIKYIPQNLIKHFLRGVFDGDGGIYAPKSNDCKVGLYGRYELLADFATYFGYSKDRIKYNPPNYRIDLSGNRQCYRILKELYSGSTIYLDRKYYLYLDHFKDFIEKDNN